VLLTKEGEATLGTGEEEIGNPNGVAASKPVEHGRNPVGVGSVRTIFSQGSFPPCGTTLGFEAESL
jgi:hypothetical protein